MLNNTLAVVSQSGQSLSFFDLATGERTGHLTDLIAEPHELVYDSKRNLLYISHAYEHGLYWSHGEYATQITVVDCDTRKVVDAIDVLPTKGTHGLMIDEQRDLLYASVEAGIPGGTGGIIGNDLESRKVVKMIGSDYTSHWFVMTPDGTKAYTCNKDADFVSIIDLMDEKMTGKIDMPGGCEQPSTSRDGKFAYFPNPGLSFHDINMPSNPCIKVIDTRTNRVVESIAVDLGMQATYVDIHDRILAAQYRLAPPEGDQKFTAEDGELQVLSAAAGGYARIGTVPVGKISLTLFASPDGRRAFVANICSGKFSTRVQLTLSMSISYLSSHLLGTVTVVDMTSMSVERTIDVDTMPRADKKYHQDAHGLALVP